MSRRVTFIFAPLLLLMVAGCSGRPSGVLGKEDMAQLMADIQTAESVIEKNYGAFPSDSAKRALLQSIYAKHGVTTEEVDSSFSWYGYNLEKYLEVYDRTIEILEKRLDKQEELAGTSAEGLQDNTVQMQGDSVDIWPGIRYRRFSRNMPNDFITFNLANDRNWERGDVYSIRAKVLDNHGPVVYSFAVEYNDGLREYASFNQSADGWQEAKIALDSSRVAQRIYGTIYYESRPGEVMFIDSITMFRTRWGGHYRDLRSSVKTFENRTIQKSEKKDSEKEPEATPLPALPMPQRLTPEQANPRNKGLMMIDNSKPLEVRPNAPVKRPAKR